MKKTERDPISGSIPVAKEAAPLFRLGIEWVFAMAVPFLIYPRPSLGEDLGPIYELFDGSTGVTCTYWNLGAKLPWSIPGGAWLDAGGASQGGKAFATASLASGRKGSKTSLDVTTLVQTWPLAASSSPPYPGILLRMLTTSGSVTFGSKESNSSPLLTIKYKDGSTASLKPRADSYLDCSSAYAKGQANSLLMTPSLRAVLSFPRPAKEVVSATLQLTVTANSTSQVSIGAYQVVQPDIGQNSPVVTGGIAQQDQYAGDVDIEHDPDVIFVERFEEPDFYKRWGYGNGVPSYWNAQVISSDPDNNFVPLSNNAYRVTIKGNANYGSSLQLKLNQLFGLKPDELYFRYYLRYAPNFRDTADGGKLPGLSGDIAICGNGGRKCDGTNGWSLRGSFFNLTEPANPAYPRVLMGSYAYTADMTTSFGEHWPWQQHGLGMLEQNRWYSVEQYVRVNTPGARDGVFRVWIDGKLAFEKTDLNVRTIDGFPIDMIWGDIYYGGTTFPGHDLTLFIDNLVVARRYIGPSF
ncbi:MAG: polysaccharide lyase [Actinomycetota bacterium]